MHEYRSECGIFTADDNGVLTGFENREWGEIRPKHARSRTVFRFIVPEGVRRIPARMFEGYEFHYARIPSSVESLGDEQACAFRFCEIFELTLPGNIRIGPQAFYGCSLRQLRFSSPPGAALLRGLGRALHAAVFDDELTEGWAPCEKTVFEEAYAEPLQTHALVNDTGEFRVDDFGILRETLIGGVPVPGGRNLTGPILADAFTVPEGVGIIPGETFCGLRVRGSLVLPSSLQVIGGCGGMRPDRSVNAFCGCDIGELTLVPGLRLLHTLAFSFSRIGRLTVAPGMGLCGHYGRQFLDTRIGELRIPARYLRQDGFPLPEWLKGADTVNDPFYGEMACVSLSQGGKLFSFLNKCGPYAECGEETD